MALYQHVHDFFFFCQIVQYAQFPNVLSTYHSMLADFIFSLYRWPQL